ncbi:MAG: protein-glutamine glutaminase family protein [Lacibacter sp.]
MDVQLVPTLFDFSLTDDTATTGTITKEEAEKLFTFFASCTLFKWHDVHNNCEARADAVCRLLEAWHIPNCKAWVFSGYFLRKHIGGLKQLWNYHVAALLPVREGENTVYYVIDPSVCNTLQTMYNWAAEVTAYPHSYHFIKLSAYYIFPSGKIGKDNWHTRNKQNCKWMIQGLAGVNGVSAKGKAQLCFNKQRIHNTAQRFAMLQHNKPKLTAAVNV